MERTVSIFIVASDGVITQSNTSDKSDPADPFSQFRAFKADAAKEEDGGGDDHV